MNLSMFKRGQVGVEAVMKIILYLGILAVAIFLIGKIFLSLRVSFLS